MTTIPATEDEQNMEAQAAHLIVAPSFKDVTTGATFVHKDLVQVAEAWDEESHIGPPKADEKFGDVESWAHYTNAFADVANMPFITWTSRGLTAVLDYHMNATNGERAAGRRQWIASHPFEVTPEFKAWSNIATGAGIEHKKFIEFLEDHAVDIFEPKDTDLLNLLRNLKGATNASFDGTVRPDGTAEIKYTKNTSVNAGSQALELPPEITIAIPVLRGHVDAEGKVVRYKLVLRLRATVGTDAHLALRLVMPQAEVVLEEVYAERVAAAKELLGDGYTILRGA